MTEDWMSDGLHPPWHDRGWKRCKPSARDAVAPMSNKSLGEMNGGIDFDKYERELMNANPQMKQEFPWSRMQRQQEASARADVLFSKYARTYGSFDREYQQIVKETQERILAAHLVPASLMTPQPKGNPPMQVFDTIAFRKSNTLVGSDSAFTPDLTTSKRVVACSENGARLAAARQYNAEDQKGVEDGSVKIAVAQVHFGAPL